MKKKTSTPKAETPAKVNISTRSKPKNRAKKRAQYLRNRAERASIYASMEGEIIAASVPEWHRRLNALSSGSYG